MPPRFAFTFNVWRQMWWAWRPLIHIHGFGFGFVQVHSRLVSGGIRDSSQSDGCRLLPSWSCESLRLHLLFVHLTSLGRPPTCGLMDASVLRPVTDVCTRLLRGNTLHGLCKRLFLHYSGNLNYFFEGSFFSLITQLEIDISWSWNENRGYFTRIMSKDGKMASYCLNLCDHCKRSGFNMTLPRPGPYVQVNDYVF